MALTTTYKCADGTDFPVTWEDPADAEKKWELESEHFGLPFLPVERDFPREFGGGIKRVFEEVGLHPPPLARARVLLIGGFAYFNSLPGQF